MSFPPPESVVSCSSHSRTTITPIHKKRPSIKPSDLTDTEPLLPAWIGFLHIVFSFFLFVFFLSVDFDECRDSQVCPSGLCYNTLGSFMCSPCLDGFEGRNGQCVGKTQNFPSNQKCFAGACMRSVYLCINTCLAQFFLTNKTAFMNVTHSGTFPQMYCVCDLLSADINECLDESVCAHGHCTNLEGYFVCTCDKGFSLASDAKACTGIIHPHGFQLVVTWSSADRCACFIL